ncbi:MAG: hypothetical protein WCF30_18775 [Terracidiphilus sp.]
MSDPDLRAGPTDESGEASGRTVETSRTSAEPSRGTFASNRVALAVAGLGVLLYLLYTHIWLIVPLAFVGLPLLGYYGVKLRQRWARVLCWVAFAGILATAGVLIWLVMHISI